METGVWAGLVAGIALLLALVCLLGVTMVSGRRTREALLESQKDLTALHARLDAMSTELERSRLVAAVGTPTDGYVVTTAGSLRRGAQQGESSSGHVPSRLVLSASVGDPLLKVMAFGYGVRMALAPQTRNRIAFEMRQEVKRSRRQRKRDLRQSRRDAGAAERRMAA